MRRSIAAIILSYLKDVLAGCRSVLGSCFTALPYFFSLSSSDLRKEVTEQYPDPISSRTADDLPSRTRGLLFNDIEKCTGCRECEKVCPTRCISIEEEPEIDPQKRWVAIFDVDFARCTFCGLCVEACTPGSLIHTKQYEGAVYLLSDLVASFGKGRLTDEQREKWATLRQIRETEDLTV